MIQGIESRFYHVVIIRYKFIFYHFIKRIKDISKVNIKYHISVLFLSSRSNERNQKRQTKSQRERSPRNVNRLKVVSSLTQLIRLN